MVLTLGGYKYCNFLFLSAVFAHFRPEKGDHAGLFERNRLFEAYDRALLTGKTAK